MRPSHLGFVACATIVALACRADAQQPARATVTIEWTSETRGAARNGVAGQFSETSKETGTLTAVLDMPSDMLPGGMSAAASGAVGGYHIIAAHPRSGSSGMATVISASGSVGLETTHKDLHKADCKGGGEMGPIDALSWTGSGRFAIRPEQVVLTLSFRGEKPSGYSLMFAPVVTVTRKGTSACGKPIAGTDSVGVGMNAVSMDAPGQGWKFTQGGTPGKLTLTARRDADDASGETHTTQTATITWQSTATATGAEVGAQARAVATAAAGGGLTSGKGSIAFTQNGKSATWALGEVQRTNMGPVMTNTFMFTPDGKEPGSSSGTLTVSVTDAMGNKLVVVSISGGPGGEVNFEQQQCTVQLNTSDPKQDKGSGECKAGSDTVKFTFTAAK